MDEKSLKTLEYPKVLRLLAERCAFSGSSGLALSLRPSSDLETAQRKLAETTEARRLLDSRPNTTIGGARDVREHVETTTRGAVLDPPTVLDIKSTLVSARELRRLFDRADQQYPYLSEISEGLTVPDGLVDAISQVLSDRGDVHDNASDKLGRIRRELRIVHDRLLSKMQSMLNSPKVSPYLQDNLITMRDGRYVIPLRADFKGKIKAVIHDQSSSGATLFVEPLSVVEQNNQYRQLELDERDEVRRILAELSARIADHAQEINWMVETIAELDLVFARAKYAEDIGASEPGLVEFRPAPGSKRRKKDTDDAGTVRHPGSTIRLLGARHPLLDRDTVVPIDMVLDPRTYALIITGPNTGGKTVTLKTVGLLILMAQSGMHIPVESGSEVTCFESIYADIGDEQSIEQSLSTFPGTSPTLSASSTW